MVLVAQPGLSSWMSGTSDMDFSILADVRFGSVPSLYPFLFENGLQHQLFRDTLYRKGVSNVPSYPLIDLDPDNLDDWLLAHENEHQFFAAKLHLSNPFNMLDVDWNDQDSFYDWVATHLLAHEQIASSLNLSTGE